tara:strand:+ start:210 stop:413 length:204 start_codon:yes stop_codon:yes gene_type:complete
MKCKKKKCCKVTNPKNVTEVAYEMSGTIVITQCENGSNNEVYLCKEDVAKIVQIALTSNIASKEEFA